MGWVVLRGLSHGEANLSPHLSVAPSATLDLWGRLLVTILSLLAAAALLGSLL